MSHGTLAGVSGAVPIPCLPLSGCLAGGAGTHWSKVTALSSDVSPVSRLVVCSSSMHSVHPLCTEVMAAFLGIHHCCFKAVSPTLVQHVLPNLVLLALWVGLSR